MFKTKKEQRIFLDHASGTPIDPVVFSAMKPYLTDRFYNPSALYGSSVAIAEDLYTARKRVSEMLQARPSEIIFPDGGTEANNLALFGVISAWKKKHPGNNPHVITSVIEHSSILEACKKMEEEGVLVSYLPVDQHGRVSLKELKEAITENTVLVSIAYVNGEIGSIEDIKGIAKTLRHARKTYNSSYPYFHTDAVQAVNYLPITVPQLGVDLMTINASKIYGPKKIALLYIKSGVVCDPLIVGGSQEAGMRAGTENTANIMGMEAALTQTLMLQDTEKERLEKLRAFFINELKKEIPEIIINAEGAECIPNIVNISIPDLSSEEIVLRLDAKGIMASVKSACKSGEAGDSHVILALRTEHTGSIRFSLGRSTSKKDLTYTTEQLGMIVKGMKEVSTTYQY